MSGRTEWQVGVSNFAARTNNPIRSLVDSLQIEPHPEKQMIALSIGDPTTFGNLKPPKEVIDALKESVVKGSWNGYAASTGHASARTAVAQYSSTHGLRVAPEDVILCSGCSSSLDLCITVLAGPGQNILVPRPGFSIYRTLAEGLEVNIRYYDLKPDQGWEADIEQLEAEIDENTAAILVNNPSNPCGSVYSAKHLTEILDVATRHYLPIIADEIYEHLVFPGSEYHPIASLSIDVPILSCSGLTKRFLVPGWRMGWIIIHDRHGTFYDVRKGLAKLSARIIGSNTLVQGALPTILKQTPSDFFNETIQTLHKHAQLMYNRLSKIPGLRPAMPQGAMYIMVGIDINSYPGISDSIEFVENLVAEESVFCLPGDCFQCTNFVRLVLTAPEPIIHEACDRIERFCRNHYRLSGKSEIIGRDELRSRGKPSCEHSGREP